MARTPDEPIAPEALVRQFQAQLAGLDRATATELAQRLTGGFVGRSPLPRPTPPSARRPRRTDVVTLQVRVDLQDTEPPLWRRLELASDMLLSELHTVLQITMGWTDNHLHRFSSGASIYDQHSESYLMQFEVDEGQPGVPEDEVRIDELLVDVGDRITYGYDFGDGWMHTVKLEAVLPRTDEAPRAVCTAGQRPGPAEDCGGVHGYEMWSVATDPTHPQHALALADVRDMYGDVNPDALKPVPFDIDAINTALAAPVLDDADLPEALADLVQAVGRAGDQAWLRTAIAGIPRPVQPDEVAVASAVRPFQWLLDQVGPDGIALTGAGYLPPAQVQAFAAELGIADSWIGKLNREVQTLPVLEFREAAQQAQLVRKHRGKLVRTPAGRKLAFDPTGLWSHLAARMPVGATTDRYERQAGLLLLIGIAAGWDSLDAEVAHGLSAIGWVVDNGPVTPPDAHRATLGTRAVLEHLGAIGRRVGGPEHVTELGVAFARAAVWTWP
ncbi:plasmid pRiA4b ORF-3 family protein [Pseudonocardia sp. TRM90224]|uniref:plasmid pRiA4b ORF-3 family protein n=1 Tax=Pseudonocardia sp. TRM90224 TaxID=2812678 RepID=UPI001E59207C|nr:plasmid pRiA4b ORF-3 family protein [Pseudonocardia sp. TRM90224]